MKRILTVLSLTFSAIFCHAQQSVPVSCASFLNPQAKSDVTIPFRYTDEGVATPLEWGLDLAWFSEENVRTGVLYAGKDLIDVVRLSFQPTFGVVDGSLHKNQLDTLNTRANIVRKWLKKDVGLYINCDHPRVDAWYNSTSVSSLERGKRWAKLIDLSIDYYKSKGLTNWVGIMPFNEPDYGWGQGANGQTKNDFRSICQVFKTDEAYKDKYADVRLCGGNTLNNDKALEWWKYSKDYLDEGNTHQLAGEFDTFAEFYEELTQAGHHATADELHNVMECMVGAEYGLQTGIWWGTNEYTRTQFMKATYHRNPGKRLAYAEHRPNWTAASIYRHADGQVQAFGGMSERQSATTRYEFVATDRPVWYDGQRGRNHVMHLPGGTGYQQGQTNAEVTVNVQSGRDVMPQITEGVYKLVNVNSGLIAGYSSKPTSGWTSLTQRKNNNTYKYLQWKVTPIHKTGDFSYYHFVLNTDNGMYMDVKDWNYNSGADIGVYPGDGNVLQQWYLEYAGEGAFYIRSRYSAKCLEVADSKTTAGANICVADFTGQPNQQWRFLPARVTPDQKAPAAPAELTATPQDNSVSLQWQAPADKDVLEYVVLRNGYVLAKNLTTTDFVDNEAEADSVYNYSVYAIDKSFNYSEESNLVSNVSTLNQSELVQSLPLDSTLTDATPNANHAALCGEAKFVTNNEREALNLNGTDNYVQLPYTVANHDALSVSMWLYYRGGGQWQRAWDFGNDAEHYMFLTTNCGSGPRFAIKNGGAEETVTASQRLTTSKWYHIVVTIGDGTARLYINGELKGENTNITVKPTDIRPALNYIGRSQFASDPMLRAYVDEFRIYNYALSAEEVQGLTTAVAAPAVQERADAPAYDLNGMRATQGTRLQIQNGKKVLR